MMCYRDRTWCFDSISCGSECSLKITEAQLSDAKEKNLPVAWAEYKNTEMCPGYTPKTKDKHEQAQHNRKR